MKQLEYTPEGFREYLQYLKKGDVIIIKKDGHEFVKTTVTSTGDHPGVVRAIKDVFSAEDGVSQRTAHRIMCPSKNVLHQWEVCIHRGTLADRADKAFSHEKCMKLIPEDLKELLRLIGVNEDWIHNADREFRETVKLKKEFSDIACRMWRYNVIVKIPLDDLEYLVDMLEGRLVH
jgi:hypothetical protein